MRFRTWVVISIVWAMACQTAVAASSNDSGETLLDLAKGWSKANAAVVSQSAGGPLFSSSLVTETGVLVMHYAEGGDGTVCSATAISPTHILTAAHCVCGVSGSGRAFESYKACQPWIARTSAIFYSPSSGVRQVQSFTVNDKYSAPWTDDHGKRPLADLAIGALDRPVDNFVATVGASDPFSPVMFSSSSGTFSVSDDGVNIFDDADTPGAKYPPGTVFPVGVEQFANYKKVGVAAKLECNYKTAPPDSLCISYDNVVHSAAPGVADSTVCGGDSGGGLFTRINEAGDYRLGGVISAAVAPQGQLQDDCSADGNDAPLVVDVRSYATWIAAHAGDEGAASQNVKCLDTLWHAEAGVSLSGSIAQRLSAVAFADQNTHPTIHIETTGRASCASQPFTKATGTFCRLPDPGDAVHITSDQGFFQVTLCDPPKGVSYDG